MTTIYLCEGCEPGCRLEVEHDDRDPEPHRCPFMQIGDNIVYGWRRAEVGE